MLTLPLIEPRSFSECSMAFVHLRVYSSYSLLLSAARVEDIAERAAHHQMSAIAITDMSNMFGALEFSTNIMKRGIQPIMGITVNLRLHHGALITGRQMGADQSISMVLLAKNEAGYKNIVKISSRSYQNSTNYPFITYNELTCHGGDLVALIGCVDGIISTNMPTKEDILKLKDLFPDRLYLEIQRYPSQPNLELERSILEAAQIMDLPIVATNSVYFKDTKMRDAHDALLCISSGKYISQDDRRHSSPDFYLKSSEEMKRLFHDLPEAIENANLIAKRCAFAPSVRDPVLPTFSIDGALDENNALRELSVNGLIKHEKHEIKEYQGRLEYELQVIAKMGFSGYFLIVADFVNWSRQNNISVGPGRGSGAGSLVAWVVGITDVDPIRFGLLFERFLNPERVSLPDFDIDFCQEKRDQIILYVHKKYGADKVAQIITFGKLQTRAVLRDVGRVLGMPYSMVDRLCKMIPNNPAHPITLAEAMTLDVNLRREYENDDLIKNLINISLQLEGLYRHASVHAAGLIISSTPIEDVMPLYYDNNSADALGISQYSMKYVELAGFIKFDFLGLKTITLIDKTIQTIAQHKGKQIDILNIDFNDKATFQMLSRGEVSGVFQLEGQTSRRALQQLKPDCIEDIIALISLNRPGPMENIPTYIARKHGSQAPDYMHPLLQSVLQETFGVIVYQEQVMNIARVLSGYSLGSADLLRRAMGKKIPSEMAQQREIFVSGAVNNGVDRYTATEIFDLVDKFAGYGFNKSHATAYAIISYRTAWLRANYAIEFLVSCLNLEINDTDKIAFFVHEARKSGIEVLPPDINKSQVMFHIESDTSIRYGLEACRNVGETTATEIVKARADQQYTDIFDFLRRIGHKNINKKSLESLVIAGVFDGIHSNRKQLIDSVSMLIKFASGGNIQNMQGDLFGMQADYKIPLVPTDDWDIDERLQREFTIFGFYLTGHPLSKLHYIYSGLGLQYMSDIQPGKTSIFMVIIDKIKIKSTKRGRYAILTASDPTIFRDISMYDGQINANSDTLVEGNIVFISVRASVSENDIRLVVDNIYDFNVFFAKKVQLLNITLVISGNFNPDELMEVLQDDPSGTLCSIFINYKTQGQTLRFNIIKRKLYTIDVEELRKISHINGVLDIAINAEHKPVASGEERAHTAQLT